MRTAVVIGRAAGVFEEYEAACAMYAFDEVVAVGMIGVAHPGRIDHWVSFHVELFDKWTKMRADAGRPPAGCYWGAIFKGTRLGINGTTVSPLRHAPCEGGSSGFLAAKSVALDMLGADRVVLVGVPMTAAGHHDESCITDHERNLGEWDEADKYWETWAKNLDNLRGRVRSMSGRTRDALGAPTREWLRGEEV